MNKTSVIKINFDKKLTDEIESVQFDNNSRFIIFKLINNGKAYNLTSKTVRVAGIKRDGTEIFNDCEIIDEKNGMVSMELTEQINAVGGRVVCELKVYGDNDFLLSTKQFVINVSNSVMSTKILSSNEFTALTNALREINDIDKKFAEVSSQIAEKASKSDLEIERTRITNLATLKEGSTTGDAELKDIRVGADGTVYNSAGEAVRVQIKNLDNNINKLSNTITEVSPNLIDWDAKVEKSISDEGKVLTNTNTYAWLNIPVNGGDSLVLTSDSLGKYDVLYVFAYNADGFISDSKGYLVDFNRGISNYSPYIKKYVVPDNATYVNVFALKTILSSVTWLQLEVGTSPTEYMQYGEKKFKYEKEINNKQDLLTAGYGIQIENNVISCTVSGGGGGSSTIEYSTESRIISDSYSELSEIDNVATLSFAENNVINEKARFLFGSHKIIAENNYFITSQDKSATKEIKSGSLQISFEYDGIAFEIGNRGLARFRIKVDEGNGWKYLSDRPISVLTKNGYRTYTQIKFTSTKPRKIIIETSDTVWCLRYDATHQIAPLNLKQPVALFVGSSITEGSAAGEFPMASYGSICANEMGWEYINIGVGSRGMITPTDTKPSVTEAITDIAQFTDAKYIFIGGSINDSGYASNPDALQNGLENIIDNVKTALPNAIITILGTWSPQPDSNNATHRTTNNAVKAGALAKKCAFIDSINAIAYNKDGNEVQVGTPWVTGTFSNSSSNEMSTIGNCAIIYNHESGDIDHIHPGRVGHHYIGMRLASACRALGY